MKDVFAASGLGERRWWPPLAAVPVISFWTDVKIGLVLVVVDLRPVENGPVLALSN
jgi:hypothetical protein